MRDDTDGNTDFSVYDAIIPSPGIPQSHPVYQTGKVIAELDFARQFLPHGFEIIAVTGTDGKSTTTWMLFSILQKLFSDKKKVYISGNFEIPFSETVRHINEQGESMGIIVVEVSSFMAYYIGKSSLPAFAPDYTILTNLTPDHLNWHADLQEYANAKYELVTRTKQAAYINEQVQVFTREESIHLPSSPVIHCFADSPICEDFTDGNTIFLSREAVISLDETHFSGRHNALNLLSVLLVLRDMSVDIATVQTVLKSISGLPHRLENLGKYGRVTVIEDSKSTSSQSLAAALSSFGNEKNILLIAGGSDKGDSFDGLAPAFRARIKRVACMGATKSHFMSLAERVNIPFLETDSMEVAVNWLYSSADEDDILMLSPGCASFGLFRDYLDRAEQFRSALKKLPI